MSKTIRFGLAFAGLIALVPTATPARAALIGAFSGNTQPAFGATDAYVDFAVFNTTGGTAGDTYGTGNAGFDSALTAAGISTTPGFLYLYEISNVSTTSTIISMSAQTAPIAAGGSSGLSLGILGSNLSLNDNLGQVSSTNPFGTGAAANIVSGPSVNPPGSTPWVVTNSNVVAQPTSFQFGSGLTTANNFTLNVTLAGGATSRLFGYTSAVGPNGFTTASVINQLGQGANGAVPTSVPEPGPVALASIGGLVAAAGAFRRRRAAKASA